MREWDLDNLFEWHAIPDIRWPHFWRVFEHLIIQFNPWVWEVIKSLARHLPCSSCKRWLLRYFDSNPFPDNRRDALEWLIVAHNYVNKMNWKKEYSFMDWLKEISKPMVEYLDNYEEENS